MITPDLKTESGINMPNMTDERWLVIPDTLGLYKISNLGRVQRTTPARILKPSNDGKGYARVNLSINGKVTLRYIAHLVLEAFAGSRPHGNEARHLNGNSQNNTIDNLAWGTKSDNMQDALRHGTFPVLECRPGAVLSQNQAIAIFTSTDTPQAIAKKFGIGAGVVRQIKLRITWASVTKDLPDAAWRPKPKHSQAIIDLATDPTKTRLASGLLVCA